MDTFDAKIVSMALLGLVSLILGLFPILLVRKLAWGPNGEGMSSLAKTILSGLLCFGGGVLMATGFLHLLPEIHDGFQVLAVEGKVHTSLPVGEIIICAGFFLVYFVEEVVHWVADRHAHTQKEISFHRAISVRACSVSRETELSHTGNPVIGTGVATAPTEDCQQTSKCQLPCEDGLSCTGQTLSANPLNSANTRYGSLDQLVTPVSETASSYTSAAGGSVGKEQKAPKAHRFQQHGHSHDPGHGHQHHNIHKAHHHKADRGHAHHHHHVPQGGSSLQGLLVIVALSLHEVFEGLAVGLQSDASDVWQLFAAIASHKYVISVCVGLELATTGVSRKLHAVYILVFSFVTPLGIGIGLALTDSLSDGDVDNNPAVLTLQALATGTILYVAFFEILERERSKSTVGMLQLLLLIAGFLAMLGLEAITSEPEGEPEHEPIFQRILKPNVTQL